MLHALLKRETTATQAQAHAELDKKKSWKEALVDPSPSLQNMDACMLYFRTSAKLLATTACAEHMLAATIRKAGCLS